jgi:hypothetical protein
MFCVNKTPLPDLSRSTERAIIYKNKFKLFYDAAADDNVIPVKHG